MKEYISQTFQEDGETIMQLPIELCKELNIGPGTEMIFSEEDGKILLKRKNELKNFAVETFVTFRHVYFVRAESVGHAMDEVTCNGNLQYFQSSIGEDIFRSQEVSNSQIAHMIKETEQPDMTLAELESGNWLKNCINTIDYSNEHLPI